MTEDRLAAPVGRHVPGPPSARPKPPRVQAAAAPSPPSATEVAGAALDPTRPRVPIVVEFLGSAADLARLGATVLARAGGIFAAYTDREAIEELLRHPATLRAEIGRPWAPPPSAAAASDPVRTPAGAAAAQPGSPTAPASAAPSGAAPPTGRGVRLAVVDLGFDFLHPALVEADPTGGEETVRTVWLHDMALAPSRLAQTEHAVIGRRFTRGDLQAALDGYHAQQPTPPSAQPPAALEHLARLLKTPASPEADLLQQHGTAVAGLAGGGGRGKGSTRPGAAPAVDFALIAIGDPQDEGRLADAAEILSAFAMAFDDTDPPCVALMANSDTLGPHDGSLLGERFLDELLLLPGRAIVVTAGNLNHDVGTGAPGGQPASAAFHAYDAPAEELASGAQDGTPEAGRAVSLVLEFGDGCTRPDAAEVWFQSAAGRSPAVARISAELEEVPPAGGTVGPAVVAEDAPASRTLVGARSGEVDAGQSTVVEALLRYDQAAAAHCLRLTFRPPAVGGRPVAAGRWTIGVDAVGPVHGWLDRNNKGRAHWVGDAAKAGANRTTLGSPAAAVRPVTVGSVFASDETGRVLPSPSSGRGPVRRGPQKKPDLVAIGEAVTAPVGRPHRRRVPGGAAVVAGLDEADYAVQSGGTSFAAPQVAGACARLFEHFGFHPAFGPAATWADLRQVLLESARRLPGMPEPDVAGWDGACGYGLLNSDGLLARPRRGVDLWLPKAPGDNGFEPYVAPTFWASPALMLEDEAGRRVEPATVALPGAAAAPANLRVQIANGGAEAALGVAVRAWWAPLGALRPLLAAPHPAAVGRTSSAWRSTGIGGASGNIRRVDEVPPGGRAEVVFDYAPPLAENGRVRPHMLVAAVDAEADPFDPTEDFCALNNVAALCVAAAGGGSSAVPFEIWGSEDTDGAILWMDGAGAAASLRIDDLPVSAIPWRDARLYERSGHRGPRPRHGDADEAADPAGGREVDCEMSGAKAIEAVTDILGATWLSLAQGRVTVAGGPRLTLPRLRIAPGAVLRIKATPAVRGGGALHLLHLSGGRRVGGGSAFWADS